MDRDDLSVKVLGDFPAQAIQNGDSDGRPPSGDRSAFISWGSFEMSSAGLTVTATSCIVVM
jgi:hypothetical protein